MKRVLITGADGFIGRRCLPQLAARGFDIHAVSRRLHARADSHVTWHQLDLLDVAAARQTLADVMPSHLLHLAWITTPGEYWNSAENVRWFESGLELCRAFAECGGRRATIAGTCAEYDRSAVEPRREDRSLIRPWTLYGTMKHALHLMCEAELRRRGVVSAWCRLFFLYGPGEHPRRLVPQVMQALAEGRPVPTTHGEQDRDFLHVDDAAAALAAVLDSTAAGPINVASGESVRLKDLIHAIADLFGRRDLIRLGAIPADPGEPSSLTADVTRLRDEIGWTPRYNLATGLTNIVVGSTVPFDDEVSRSHFPERFVA